MLTFICVGGAITTIVSKQNKTIINHTWCANLSTITGKCPVLILHGFLRLYVNIIIFYSINNVCELFSR